MTYTTRSDGHRIITSQPGAEATSGGERGQKRQRVSDSAPPARAGFFPFILIDACHSKLASFEPYLAYGKQAGYAVYILEMASDGVEVLVKRTEAAKRRTREQVLAMRTGWEEVPGRFYSDYGLRTITGIESIVRQEEPAPPLAAGAAPAAPVDMMHGAEAPAAVVEAPAAGGGGAGAAAAATAAEAGDFFEWGSGALIKQMFRVFDRDRDGCLKQSEYSAFCVVTEGAECDDKRWKQHSSKLGMVSGSKGLRLQQFAKLYTEARFKKHFGKVRSELEKAKESLKEKRTALNAKQSGLKQSARKLRGALRVGSSAGKMQRPQQQQQQQPAASSSSSRTSSSEATTAT